MKTAFPLYRQDIVSWRQVQDLLTGSLETSPALAYDIHPISG